MPRLPVSSFPSVRRRRAAVKASMTIRSDPIRSEPGSAADCQRLQPHLRLIIDNIALNESRAECHDLDWEDPVLVTDRPLHLTHPQASPAQASPALSAHAILREIRPRDQPCAFPCRSVPQAVPRELLGCNLVVAADVVYNETVVPILVVSSAALTRILRPRSASPDGRCRVLGRVAAACASRLLERAGPATRTDRLLYAAANDAQPLHPRGRDSSAAHRSSVLEPNPAVVSESARQHPSPKYSLSDGGLSERGDARKQNASHPRPRSAGMFLATRA